MGECVGHASVKWASLATIVLQNSTLIVLACYSRTIPGPQYLGSVAVLLTECVKGAANMLGACASSRSMLPSELRAYLLHEPRHTLLFAAPALCYTLHNNLWYVAVTNLDPVTVGVFTQLKIAFAAFFSVCAHTLHFIRCPLY